MNQLKRIRCAVYTRKSSEEGLDQTFNSLDAQREACEAYVLSQKHEGWEVIHSQYDDGGFSGGNMERPGLKKLLADIASKAVDTVVVYKVDRLTRSLTDFAKIVDQFDGQGVSFVSVTQQFNTTTSMGRLTLNVLLSFAQFEREVTGERIRDKIAASKRKGMWMGGVVPLGYDLQDRLLIMNEREAELVRNIFGLYLELGCVSKLQSLLDERGIRSKKRLSRTGQASGDAVFSRGSLYELLQNPLYLGEIRHKEERYPGQHPAIIERDVWDRVQQTLIDNRPRKAHRAQKEEDSILTGILFDGDGNRYTPSHTTKTGRCYRYYVSQASIQLLKKKGASPQRLPAKNIEAIVLGQIAELLKSPEWVAQLISNAPSDHSEMERIVSALEIFERSRRANEIVLERCVQRVVIDQEGVAISVLRRELRAAIGLEQAECPEGLAELRSTAALKRVGGEMRFELLARQETEVREIPSLVRAIVNARDWLDRILTGTATNQRVLAQQTGFDERYISRLLPLAFLAPDIMESIFEGVQPVHWCLDVILGKVALEWNQQRRVFERFDRASARGEGGKQEILSHATSPVLAFSS